jgi:uncharacterized Zn-finger protein
MIILHLILGDKPYQCTICKKRFSEANIMTQHMRTHTGERPFKCTQPDCGREFSISGALTIHLRVHTGICKVIYFSSKRYFLIFFIFYIGEKPFKCKFDGCVKRFAESSNLTKHVYKCLRFMYVISYLQMFIMA